MNKSVVCICSAAIRILALHGLSKCGIYSILSNLLFFYKRAIENQILFSKIFVPISCKNHNSQINKDENENIICTCRHQDSSHVIINDAIN